jgi:hypothetical protein
VLTKDELPTGTVARRQHTENDAEEQVVVAAIERWLSSHRR